MDIGNLTLAIDTNDIEKVKKIIIRSPELINFKFSDRFIRQTRREIPLTQINITPLIYTCFAIHDIDPISIEKRYEIIKFLLESGGNINQRNEFWQTPLLGICKLLSICHHNEKKNDKIVKIIELFFDYEVDINVTDYSNNNALHCLFEYGINETILDVAKILIKKGININQKNIANKTPIEIVLKGYLYRYSNSKKICEDLLQLLILMFDSGLDIEKDKLCTELICRQATSAFNYAYDICNKFIKTIYEYDLRKELKKKDEKIAKLEKTIEDLRYRPYGDKYWETIQDFDKLVNIERKN